MDERDDDEGDASMEEAPSADAPQNASFTLRPTEPRQRPAPAPNRSTPRADLDQNREDHRPTQTLGTTPAGVAGRRNEYQADRGTTIQLDTPDDQPDEQPEESEKEPEGGWKILFGITKRRPKPYQPVE